jgi:hypothetical protein
MSWIINENPQGRDYRELELDYEKLDGSYGQIFIRLLANGDLQLGEKHSDFKVEYVSGIYRQRES